MIVHYNKKTGLIYGTSNGFKITNLTIRPIDVPCDDVGQIVISREFMDKKPSLIKKISQHKVVKANGDNTKFKFVGEPKPGKSVVKAVKKETIVDQIVAGLEDRLDGIIEKKVEKVLAQQKAEAKKKE